MDRLTRLRDAKGVATLADHQYQYNTASQIAQIAKPTNTHSYGYDTVDRLTSAGYTSPTQSPENYAYDSVGNRASSHLSASYSYQAFNRLASTSTATISYDSNGNMLSKTDPGGTTQYAWDFENRLKQVTLPNGSTVSPKCDALGRRVHETVTWPSLEEGLSFVLDKLRPVNDVLETYKSNQKVILWCGHFQSDSNASTTLSSNILKKLGDFGVQLFIDSYCSLGPEEEAR
jgi:YD repeat-containing protein